MPDNVIAIDPQNFEGIRSAKELTRNLFLDSVIIAITTVIIGLPAVNWIYSYLTFTLKVVPIIQCFPPNNVSVSRNDIEYFCFYYHSLNSSFFSILVTFCGFWIAVVHFIWKNYNSGKFDLFFSLVKQISNEKEKRSDNILIVKQIQDVFLGGNSIYISYIVVKSVQAVVSFIAIIITVVIVALMSIDRHSTTSPTFVCQLDQFEQFINSPSSPDNIVQVPCIEITVPTTVLVLCLDLFLLFVIFVLSIISMIQQNPKELTHSSSKCHEAAKFSFHTGMSFRFYPKIQNRMSPPTKQSGMCPKCKSLKFIDSDLSFLAVLLRRTDSGFADLLWETQTLNEIELLNNDDILRSNLNYSQQLVDTEDEGKEGLSLYSQFFM